MKRSRAIFAQNALKPDEVLPEWRRMRALNGGPAEVERFTRRALSRLNADLGQDRDLWRVHYDRLPQRLRERLAARGLVGTRTISFADLPPPDVAHVGRVHPLVAMLAETMAEGALDPGGVDGEAPLGRAGAWRTRGVAKLTTVLLLRLRFTLVTSGRRTLLAEEATALAFDPDGETASGAGALALLEAEASGNLDPAVIARQIEAARDRVAGYQPAVRAYANIRAAALREDHDRVKAATRGEGVTTEVSPVLPADVIGLYVLVPEAN